MYWHVAVLLTAVLICALPNEARAQAGLPPNGQIVELANSSEEKVSAFEDAVNSAKPWLDKLDAELSTGYLAGAVRAHALVRDIQKNGGQASSLVSLQATLDELNLDGISGSLQLMAVYAGGISIGLKPDAAILSMIMHLSDAGDACGDSAESVLQAALRVVSAEEELLGKGAGK